MRCRRRRGGGSPAPDRGYPNGNTAEETDALFSLTTGATNTAIGFDALFNTTTGFGNTATGLQALYYSTTGSYNAASGVSTLFDNTTGYYNTANGVRALLNNTTGNSNTANGVDALGNNTAGSGNIALGHGAGGNLSGASVAGGVDVIVDSSGHLGTVVSLEHFKDGIKPMDKASEALLALEPVTFRYKHDLDPKGIPQFGLVAEQVEKVNPDLVARDEQGKPYTVRYEAVNGMLLNEFLKEHCTVQELKSTVAKQEAIIAQQQKGMEAVTARLDEQAL